MPKFDPLRRLKAIILVGVGGPRNQVQESFLKIKKKKKPEKIDNILCNIINMNKEKFINLFYLFLL